MTNTRGAHAEPGQSRPRRRKTQQRECPKCGQVFYKAGHLDRHIRSHTKERPFGCGLCDKTYSRQSATLFSSLCSQPPLAYLLTDDRESDSLLRHARTHAVEDGELPPTQELMTAVSPPQPQFGGFFSPAGMAQARSLQSESQLAHDSRGTDIATTTVFTAQTTHAEPMLTATYAVSGELREQSLVSGRPCPLSPVQVQELDASVLAASSVGRGPSVTDSMGGSASMDNTQAAPGDLNFGLSSYEPAWLLGEDFDIDALNFSISAAIADWPPLGAVDSLEQRRIFPGANALNDLNTPSPSLETVSRVQHDWHTRVSRAATPQNSTTQLPDQDLVDERYRDGLSNRLQPRIRNTALPSARFLVS